MGQRRGRLWDILVFVFLIVENEAIRCVGKKETRERMKKERTRRSKEENKWKIGKCERGESFRE